MNVLITYSKKILFSLGLIVLLGFIGCKSPIDLDDSVSEVPVQTNPVDRSSMRFSVGGDGKTMRFLPNSQPEDIRFLFNSYDIENIHIDTTDRFNLKVAMKYKISTDIGDSSRFEEVLPVYHECEFDTLSIPILDKPPTPKEKVVVNIKKSLLKAYIFSKKKDSNNGFRIQRNDKVFDLLDDSDGYNHAVIYVFAVRTRIPNTKPNISLVLESSFSLNTIEIESYDRKFRSNASGKSTLRIIF